MDSNRSSRLVKKRKFSIETWQSFPSSSEHTRTVYNISVSDSDPDGSNNSEDVFLDSESDDSDSIHSIGQIPAPCVTDNETSAAGPSDNNIEELGILLSQSSVTAETEPPSKKTRQALSNKNKHPIKTPCDCKKNCKRNFSEHERKHIHEKYWSLNKREQRIWLNGHVEEIDVKVRKTTSIFRRSRSLVYSLNQQCGVNHKVCQQFFLRTLGYSSNAVIVAMIQSKKQEDGSSSCTPHGDLRGKKTDLKKDRSLIISHIMRYNPEPSHYRRSHAPNRLYLPPDLNVRYMHTDYNRQFPKISYELYRQTVKKLNISFYLANVEKCGYCVAMDVEGTEEARNKKLVHLSKNRVARNEYQADQRNTEADVFVFSVDMQKVCLLPRMPHIKETFFTRRLIAMNETFVSMKPNSNHICVLWHEAIRGRKMEDVASAFIRFFKMMRDARTIILWMDNCTGQNKNTALYSAIVTYLNQPECSTSTIILKYLVVGHTFMAADGVHGHIEQKMRKAVNVYDFQDFVSLCGESSARTSVATMDAADFIPFKNMFRPRNTNNNIPLFQSIVEVKFENGETDYKFKTNFEDDYKTTSQIIRPCFKFESLDRHEENRNIGIYESKKEEIIKHLVPSIPKNRVSFWQNLPTNKNKNDTSSFY